MGRQASSIEFVHVDRVSQHELLTIIDGVITAPVQLEHLAIRVEHASIRAGQILVLHDCADYLRKERRVLLLEQVQSDTEALCEQVKLTRGKITVRFVSHALLTELVCR